MGENFRKAVEEEALKIFEHRRDRLEAIERQRQLLAQQAAIKLLQIFGSSTDDRDSELLVCKIRVKSDGKTLACFVSFSYDEEPSYHIVDDRDASIFDSIFDSMEFVKDAIFAFQLIKPNDTIISDMYNLLVGLPNYQIDTSVWSPEENSFTISINAS